MNIRPAIRKAAVLGAGVMGAQIAAHLANADIPVVLFDLPAQDGADLNAPIKLALKNLGKLEPAPLALPERAQFITPANYEQHLALLRECDLIIEAIAERPDWKADLYRKVAPYITETAYFVTNTSGLSITQLAQALPPALQARFCGMHFFNPVPIMQPVEIVRGVKTSDETVAATAELAKQMGKEALVVQDAPGFVVNRVLMPMINEAVYALQEGVAEPAAIDRLMKLGCNHPMGPLELADLIGLDVCLSIMRVLHDELGDSKYRPCPLLVRMVDAGKLGRKSGEGFYSY